MLGSERLRHHRFGTIRDLVRVRFSGFVHACDSDFVYVSMIAIVDGQRDCKGLKNRSPACPYDRTEASV